MWDDRRIPFDGYDWPPEAFLQSLKNRELGGEEFWRRLAHAAVAMRDDEIFVTALNDVKRDRFKAGFPSMEGTTSQNRPCQLPSRLMPSGGNESKPSGQRKKSGVNASVKPKTLIYYKHGNKGMLSEQRQRVHIVFRLWNSWGWLDDQTEVDDFDRFWEGAPRACNISWTANSTILTILLQKLIAQPYIEEQTGLAAKSMVEQQFGMTANSDRKRLTDDDETKIQLTLLVLDIRNPLQPSLGNNTDEDIEMKTEALWAVAAGQLRNTKGI